MKWENFVSSYIVHSMTRKASLLTQCGWLSGWALGLKVTVSGLIGCSLVQVWTPTL